jgi:hypothetical protein
MADFTAGGVSVDIDMAIPAFDTVANSFGVAHAWNNTVLSSRTPTPATSVISFGASSGSGSPPVTVPTTGLIWPIGVT